MTVFEVTKNLFRTFWILITKLNDDSRSDCENLILL